MEPLLFERCSPGLAGDCERLPGALPWEDVEPLLTMRFVVMSAGLVGGGVCDRNAVAAAADDSDALLFALFTNAEVAARAAEEDGAVGAC